MICGWPSAQGPLSSLIRKWPFLSDRLVGAGTWLLVFATVPVENAAELVMILNVEPGGKVTWVARLSSGLLLAALKRLLTLASFPVSRVAKAFGLNDGLEAMARMAPVLG